VKKGGAGGLVMLLAGYCVLGYIWKYPHLSKCADHPHVSSPAGAQILSMPVVYLFFFPERDRWRKYH